jgi:hypothetical protein
LLKNRKQEITEIVSHDTQVWILVSGTSVIYEYDVESRQELCRLSFQDTLTPGSCLLQEPAEEEIQSSSNPTVVKKEAEPNSLGSPQPNLNFRRRKSFRKHSGRKKGIAKSSGRVEVRAFRVKSATYVNGTLWVVLSQGMLVVLNVQESNSHSVHYGEILAVLQPSTDIVSTVRVTTLPGNLVVAISYRQPSEEDVTLPIGIDLWRALSLDDWVQRLAFVKHLKSSVEEHQILQNTWKRHKAGRYHSNPL